jgi:hypothetical protein
MHGQAHCWRLAGALSPTLELDTSSDTATISIHGRDSHYTYCIFLKNTADQITEYLSAMFITVAPQTRPQGQREKSPKTIDICISEISFNQHIMGGITSGGCPEGKPSGKSRRQR